MDKIIEIQARLTSLGSWLAHGRRDQDSRCVPSAGPRQYLSRYSSRPTAKNSWGFWAQSEAKEALGAGNRAPEYPPHLPV